MEWDRLEFVAASILRLMAGFAGAMPADYLLTLLNQENPGWRSERELMLTDYQAFDLLEHIGLVDSPDGANPQLTEAGKVAAQAAIAGIWHIDIEDPAVELWADKEALASINPDSVSQSENTFHRLQLAKWRQFEAIDITFHPRLTILTGANGAGKTTLLNILAPHFSWNAQLISSPSKGRPFSGQPFDRVGRLFYTNGGRTPILQPVVQGVQVNALQMSSQQMVPGLFISSHRSISSYQQLQNLPARFSAANVLLGQFAGEVQARYLGGMSQFSPLYRMKEALVAAALHGYGSVAVNPNPEAREIWEGFQEVLSKFLPKGLQFEALHIADGDVLLKTRSSQFPLEAVSGGLSAMLELAWQIFLRGRDSPAFTVCIDEPENHLHPELQRTIVPALLEAFPAATFVIATHSPFVVTASRDSSVYALTAGSDGIVNSRFIQRINASGTSDETLMSVLGLDTPLPLWAEEGLRDAIANLPADPSPDQLRQFRAALIDAGLGEQFPAALKSIGSGDPGD